MILSKLSVVSRALAGLLLAGVVLPCPAADKTDPQIDRLIEENRKLREQVQDQQRQIDALSEKIAEILKLHEKSEVKPTASLDAAEAPRDKSLGPREILDRFHLSGEGGTAFFRSGSEGAFPNGEFRVDEAKLFLEAPIWRNVFLFSELDVVTREANDEYFHLGELYVDFENVSALWNQDKLLSLRVGRFDIPFGEEYSNRDVIDNPLISHSVSDVWGIDEGIGIYGTIGRFQYVAAVQNGSHPTLRDFNSDKSVAGRLSYGPAPWLRLSLSGMRTGDLDAAQDRFSEAWFGNGFIRSLGAPATTSEFGANLVELDAAGRWRSGHVKAAGGLIRYDDNDATADNRRDAYYYYVESKQSVVASLYGAARFSQIVAHDGFPLVGHGTFAQHFFGPLTKDLSRLSLGLGYQLNSNLVIKAEYAWEFRQLLNGIRRRHTDLFATQVGFRF